MTPTISASLLALGLLVQTSPPSGAAGSAGAVGSGGVHAGDATSGATTTKQGKSRGNDLADLLTRILTNSGGQQGGRISPPSPPGGDNVRVSSPSGKEQWMPAIAVDPSDRLHLVGAARDDRNFPGYHAVVFYSSFDGGQSWNELFHGGPGNQDFRDPAVAVGAGGTVYCVANWPFGPGSVNYIGPSFDGGVTVPNWYSVDYAGTFNDRPAVAVDRTTGTFAGNVYVAFDWFQPAEIGSPTYGIAVAASSDGGQTSNAVNVNDLTSNVAFSRRPSIAVDSAGVVHVVWYDDGLLTLSSDRSSDGGATWGTDVPIASADPFSIPRLGTVSPSPELAIDTSGGPFDGTLYVTWAQKGGAGDPDVMLSKSSDGGATWSTPVVASDVTTNSQFTPSITVDPQGNVVVGFYDRRDDANDVRVNFYVSRSSDGGVTFQPNVKVSDADFDPTAYGTGVDIVTRTGVAASDREIHAIWTDGRHGNNDVFTAPANLALFTDVATISAATGGTATFSLDAGPLFGLTEYHVLGSLSGTLPGTDFYFENVPINYDLFTLATIYEANGSIFPGFTGNLDATGAATAQLVSGPLPPALVGVQMDFAALVRVAGGVRWGSAPTRVEIGN